MKRYLLFVVLLVGLLVQAACSNSESKAAPITVENVRANMTMPTDTGSFWMLITNNSDTDDALLGAAVDGCGVIELHDMVMENDVMVMRPVAGGKIPIPAGQTVELKPGGLHVMCMQKAAPLALGTKVKIELEFANAGTITVEGEVVEPAMSSGGMNNN
ncbi:MAG: copper chaperone PCu(A)C [Chloroflexi bacterium]|nr:copper chaperone PCu(A)C [Ardenticatenaceae bacterium]MBL1127814.1 copper chaperone PCu(A)C [Chloroflexota bacterium]NOG33883.1 copper chaperone PCu(A)C [Chloroflexota bacterium]GIK54786.1 MAG: hypothetical protein BroJett015_04490 [Chloroflexota bacterium]